MLNKKLHFFKPDFSKPENVVMISEGIKAGFPSPASDFEEQRISLDQYLVKNSETTFYARASGNSMINAGIEDGDLLIIDRSLEASDNVIAICYIDGEFTVKRIKKDKDKVILLPENEAYAPIEVSKESELLIWGVVTYVIKKL
ncbi:translesion error-prone DNA polymerase V autoproteolytic subunit [Flavobacterium sp. NRK F10]|uniref:LexA family protein n=1 Tax=Flavobacterium sp. NRK F10 TaxID=2954931 RepID=UPI002090BC88|nr:translesion error-prone DNA polymerase V autoproteolytic subunit [Flavobacterium sp. NRK F10]MCO6175062.1 translesion error-prone DNA polymerase V autoproteolytic subunit [Flavobacterium sp. NRK F10]